MEQDPITRITSNSNHEIIPRQSDRSQEPRSIDVTICVAYCNLWAGHRLSDRQQWWYQMWLTLLAVTQSQSRYVACYHHHCASIIRVSAYIPLEFWNKLHVINLFGMIAGYKKKKEEEGGGGRKEKMNERWRAFGRKRFRNILIILTIELDFWFLKRRNRYMSIEIVPLSDKRRGIKSFDGRGSWKINFIRTFKRGMIVSHNFDRASPLRIFKERVSPSSFRIYKLIEWNWDRRCIDTYIYIKPSMKAGG